MKRPALWWLWLLVAAVLTELALLGFLTQREAVTGVLTGLAVLAVVDRLERR